jgi:hypothetical protein
MEIEQFDAFTRRLGGDTSRRQALRALATALVGGALGGLTARLDIGDAVEAKTAKKHKRRRKDAATSRGAVQVTGKHKHKKRHKKHNAPPPLPPSCQHCGTCEKCQDGACVPDPDLDLVRCLDSSDDPGGQCHICWNGACIPYSNGQSCNDGDECSWCQNGQCVPVPEKDLGPCGHSPCHLCDQGVCGPAGNGTECSDGQGKGVCCNHTCIHPSCDRDAYDPHSCQCLCGPGEQLCGHQCLPADGCCSSDENPYPDCGACEVAVCDHGRFVYRPAC